VVGRTFDLTHRGRALSVRVYPVDNAWELWICEKEHRIVRADVLSIDDAVLARRDGVADPVAEAVGRIRQLLTCGEIVVP
jgi:hypothetical protein